MARDSRPPGFDMSYRPEEDRRFGPSLRACRLAYLYAALSLGFVGFIAYGHVAPHGSFAWRYVIEASAERGIPPIWFATLALASGAAAVMRAHMRGVFVLPDGIETREVLVLGWPKIRRFDWPMIDRFRFDVSSKLVGVDLWNGTREYFPEVQDRDELVRALAYIAEARAIPYSGDVPGDGFGPA